MDVKRPALLSTGFKKERPLPASALSITVPVREKPSAQLRMPLGASLLPMHAFIKLYTHKGALGVFWVTNSALDDQSGRTYNLTHAIDTLRKSVYKEQTTFDGTRQAFLSTLFFYQTEPLWQLGTVDAGGAAYKAPNINYTNLSDLFTRFLNDNPDLCPVYDFSTTPWTVNIRKLPEEIGARFSLTRNAETCRITYDDKQQATRLYLAVNTPEKVNGITKYTAELKTYEDADAIAQYGAIEKTASIKTDEITGTPDDWAQEFLKKYKDPTVQITVDGYELWKQTGEIYDEMAVGKRCKVALPEFGTTTIQRIESVTYPDALKRPTAITVSLATKQKTFTAAISNLEKEVEKVGGVAGGAALSSAKAEEVYAWSLIVQKVEEAVNGTGITTLWETGIIIDAVSGATIYSLEQGFVSAFSAIKANNEGIELSVKKNGVIAAINLSSEEARIQAAKIVLDGYVTASRLETAIADVNYQNSQAIETLLLDANQVNANYLNASAFILGETLMSKKALTMGAVTFATSVLMPSTHSGDLDHSHSVTVDDDGKVTLGKAAVEGGFFNVAETKAFKEAVSAAAGNVSLSSAGWINGVNTVSASNGKSFAVSLPPFSTSGGTIFDTDHKTTVFFSTASVSMPLETVVVDASGVYDAGYAEGWAAAKARFRMEWPDQGSYDYLLNIYQPGDTPDSADVMDELQIGATYSLSEITNTAPNTFYASGWAYARTRLNGGSWTNRHRVNMTQTTTINVGQG